MLNANAILAQSDRVCYGAQQANDQSGNSQKYFRAVSLVSIYCYLLRETEVNKIYDHILYRLPFIALAVPLLFFFLAFLALESQVSAQYFHIGLGQRLTD